MQIEKDLPIILIVGAISLYFLITGIRGLIQRRMRILNPLADTPPSSPVGLALNILKKKFEADSKVPENFGDKGQMVDITGRDLLFRAWFHIIFGLLAMLVLIFFLSPELFEKVMSFFI